MRARVSAAAASSLATCSRSFSRSALDAARGHGNIREAPGSPALTARVHNNPAGDAAAHEVTA